MKSECKPRSDVQLFICLRIAKLHVTKLHTTEDILFTTSQKVKFLWIWQRAGLMGFDSHHGRKFSSLQLSGLSTL